MSSYFKISTSHIVKLEETLRMMQRRLSQIAQIPLIIQSTLDAVARSFDDFLPPEMAPPDQEDQAPLTLIDLSAFVEASQAKAAEPHEEVIPGGEDLANEATFDERDEDTAVEVDFQADPIAEPEPEPEIVEVVPEPTEEEVLRMEKIDRVIIWG